MIKKVVVTHDGRFHPDDVFAVATLQIYFGIDALTITRSRDEAVIKNADIVVDVGGEYDPLRLRFDHHQNDAPVHEDTIPYAAFGLVWKEYGVAVCGGSASAAEELNKKLVEPIDAGDNGVTLYSLNYRNVPPAELFEIIDSYRPVWGSDESYDPGFFEAVNFARDYLRRAITHALASEEMHTYVEKVFAESLDKSLIVCDLPVIKRVLLNHDEALLLVCPVGRAANSNWQAVALQKNRYDFSTKVSFPIEWRGLRDEDLAAVAKVKDAVFCHKSGHLCIAKSREGAIALAKMAK
jgi:uncharacterized UPF0160 family protein